MTKKLLQFIFVFAIFILVLTNSSKAHVLETDGSIGIVMHADPEDDPIAKQEAVFYIDIKDKEEKFQMSECECKAIISKDGKAIFEQGFLKEKTNSVSFRFTLPEKRIYKLSIQGKPKEENKFQAFEINFDMRISRQANEQVSQNDLINGLFHYWPVILIFIGFYLVAIHQKFIEKKSKSSKVNS